MTLREPRGDKMESGAAHFVQSTYVRDVVFPLFRASRTTEGIKVDSFEGTGFLIGSRGFALTAGHVAKRLSTDSAVAAFVVPDGGWYGFSIIAAELHPTEDVAVIRLDRNLSGQPWHSWMLPVVRWEGASRNYGLFGYPEDVYHEVVVDGIARGRPDLVFSQGHIRRRLTDIPLDNIKGCNFFELSQIAGSGCSGSPILCWPPGSVWEVIGIYCGERASLSNPASVGYAVRLDALAEWIPAVLGHRITEETPTVPAERAAINLR
jgi:hypothetical protein